MAVHGRQAVHGGCLALRRHGIAAPISSTVSATAPSVTARATSSAGSSQAQRFAGGPNPEGEGWVPNITQKEDWPIGAQRTSPTSSKPGRPRMATLPADRWRASSGTRRNCRRRIARRSAEYLKSLPPVEGPPRPEEGKGCREVLTGALRPHSGRQGRGDRRSPL
jgi:hypothetical protein